jgi:hypothetical protein
MDLTLPSRAAKLAPGNGAESGVSSAFPVNRPESGDSVLDVNCNNNNGLRVDDVNEALPDIR